MDLLAKCGGDIGREIYRKRTEYLKHKTNDFLLVYQT
jgi:hypothetical protein